MTDIVSHDFPPNLGRPATSALTHAGYTSLAQLSNVREKDLAKLHGMGPKGLRILREALAERGATFAQS